MLYILHSSIIFIWLIQVIRKEKYSMLVILTAYLFFVMLVDIPEIIFNQILEFYKFPSHLLTDNLKDNQLGIVFSDGIILSMTCILVCHYTIKTNKLWRVSIIFAASYGALEWIYLKLGYVLYFSWNIWFSIAIYFFVSRLVIIFSARLILNKPPLPYVIRISTSTYTVTAWFGAVLGGTLINLYQWRPHIFEDISADDRFTDLGISYIFAFLSALIISKANIKYRPNINALFAMAAFSFWIYANTQGWLIYHKWNNVLTALRWAIPFLLIIWLDHWNSKIEN